MSTNIARGATTTVPLSINPGTTADISTYTWTLQFGGGILINSWDADRHGWNVTMLSRSSASITCPSGASLGGVLLAVNPASGSGGDYRSFGDMVVVEGEPEEFDPCDYTPTLGLTTSGSGVTLSGKTATLHFEAAITSPNTDHDYSITAKVNWGDGVTTTHGLTLLGGALTAFDMSHIFATLGTNGAHNQYAQIYWTVKIDGCTESGHLNGPAALYARYFCNDSDECDWSLSASSGTGFDTCEAADCGGTPPTGDVYWCVAGHVAHGTTPPEGVTTYSSEAACIAAGCTTTPPHYTRFRCTSSGLCETFLTTNPLEGFASCAAASCSGIVEPPVYTRWRCTESGDCESFFTLNPLEGFEDCAHANCATTPEPGPCAYLSHPIANITPDSSTNLMLSLSRVGNPGWSLVVTYALGGVVQSDPAYMATADSWNWSVPKIPGVHHFVAELSKDGCETQLADLILVIGGGGGGSNPFWCVDGYCVQAATAPSGTTVSGPFASAGLCTGACGGGGPCPPPPDAFTCSPTVTFQAPAASATLKNFALVRVQVGDPNEQTDPCHHNYPRACNHETDGPDLQLFVNEYHVVTTWKRISGTPLNGVWETHLDTRDISNGAHTLKVSARGVGCCRVYNTRAVTFANTLQGNIFYRDTIAQVAEGFVISNAMIGVEVRALEENTSRRYWMQWGVRSGTTLDGAYSHDDWPKHQPVIPILGAQWSAQGLRFERRNYSAHVTFRIPLSRDVRFRRKWTPQFYLSAFDLECETVAKIREIESGRHYVFTTTPARVWMYDGNTVKIYGDFSVAPTVDEGELGDDEDEGDFEDEALDRAGSNIYAPTAIDCAVLGGETTGDKVYVVVPPSTENAGKGEVFAFDPDAKQVALEYGIRKENRIPRFVEVVGGRVVCLYIHDSSVTLPVASKHTRAYDLTFATPTLLWGLSDPATFASVDGDTLLVACSNKLYAGDGKTTPALVRVFGSAVTAATKTLVGLANGQVWKKTTDGWSLVLTRDEAIGGTASWSAGTMGEAQTEEARGVVAGNGHWLVGERGNGTWYDERDLLVPVDLAPKTVVSVAALDVFSVDVAAPSSSDDAVAAPQKDERLLVGTGQSGLFFVYQRSLLSEKDGAIAVSHDSVPRVFPFPRRAES
ncbi:hypothetical protein IAD21_00536 [Abditibacteriota bacterium]|nr:hypothetical protein IAD21_00536 [Abditibacteriota bacterium]